MRRFALVLLLAAMFFAQDVLAQSEKSLTIMTVNIEQYPAPLGRKHRWERTSLLAQVIRELRPDVLCVQEAWTEVSKKAFYFALKKSYPYKVMDTTPGKYGWGGNSGLMILSKFPIGESKVKHYSLVRGEDNLARKGILGAQLSVNGQTVLVFTTHMQAGDSFPLTEPLDRTKPSRDEVHAAQLREAQAFIAAWTATEKAVPVFFTGDFNIDPREPLFQTLRQVFPQAVDTFDAAKSPALGSTWTEEGKIKDERVDYIWSLGVPITGFSVLTPNVTLAMTDHLAGIGTFVLP